MAINIEYFQGIIETFIDDVKSRDLTDVVNFSPNGPAGQIGLAVAAIIGFTGLCIQLVKKVCDKPYVIFPI